MKIRKSNRKVIPPPPDVEAFIKRIDDAPDDQLVTVLRLLQIWYYPRGDIHGWMNVLKKFVRLLNEMTTKYAIGGGSSTSVKFQVKTFSPEDKDLILEILRFIRVLMENSTNRKLFDNYEVIHDMLLTNDFDVLEATLFAFLRPVQQYGSHLPISPELDNSIRQRLFLLSRGWDRIHVAGYDLVTYASSPEPLVFAEDSGQVLVQFYPQVEQRRNAHDAHSPVKIAHAHLETPTRPSGAALRPEPSVVTPMPASKGHHVAADSSMTTVDLGNVLQTMPGDYLDHLAALTEEHKIGVDDQLAALIKIRLVLFSQDREIRRKLLTCRLLALTCYITFTVDEAATSTIFLYEPEILGEMTSLLVPDVDVGDRVVASALSALESCCHLTKKLNEVLSALNANVNHGVLMTLLRNVSGKLVKNEPVHHDIVDALFTLLGYIGASAPHSALLVGAGIIPLLLEILGAAGSRRENYIPRAAGLIDTIVYNYPMALQAISNADGVNVLVGKIKSEVQRILDAPLPQATEIFSQETLISHNTNPLKNEMRTMYRMLQSTGGADGFRNVVDSDLPKSIKRIFSNYDKFGPRVYTHAINAMSTMIHNEPTSLSILQEAHLPQTLYEQLEQHVPDVSEVVIAIPNAIGAICLNEAGLQATLDHFEVIVNLMRVIVTWPTLDANDNIYNMGGTLDELVRHHPSLRDNVLSTLITLLEEAIEDGSNFKCRPNEVNDYAAEPASVDMDVESLAESDQSATGYPNNACLSRITNVLKLTSGLLRNASLCRSFISGGGLALVLCVADLPCVPVRFSSTELAVTMPDVLRAMGEHDHVEVAERIVLAVERAMAAVPELWQGEDPYAAWAAMAAEDVTSEDRRRLRLACGLAMRLSFLSEAYLGMAFGSQRIATALITTLKVALGSPFVSNLGILHRVCFQEHVLLKELGAPAEISAVGSAEESTSLVVPTDLDLSVAVTESINPIETPSQHDNTDAADSSSGNNHSETLPASGITNTTADGTAASISPEVADAVNASKKTPTLPTTRIQTVKMVVTRLHAILTKFFKAAIRLLFHKRSPDTSHKYEAGALANCISEIIIGHLQASTRFPEMAVAMDTVSLGLATILLFDERGAEGHIYTFLFLSFYKQHGTSIMFDTVRRILHAMDVISLVPETERTKAQSEEYTQCVTGCRISISVLNAFASPSSLLESPQTHILQQRQGQANLPLASRLSFLSLFLGLRCEVFPLAKQVWLADWLPSMSVPFLRLAIAAFQHVMEGKEEDRKDESMPAFGDSLRSHALLRQAQPEAAAVRQRGLVGIGGLPQRVPLDPSSVQQLVDMGFGRRSAERALARSRNNVAAAADMILNTPDLFPNDEPLNPEEPLADAPAPVIDTQEAAGAVAPATGTPPPAVADAAIEGAIETDAQPTDAVQAQPADAVESQSNAAETSQVQSNDNSLLPVVPNQQKTLQIHSETLKQLRSDNAGILGKRAMELIDRVEDLAFDLLFALPSGQNGAVFIIDKLAEVAAEDPIRDTALSSRLRLLSVFARLSRANSPFDLTMDESKRAMSILQSLPVNATPRPRWLPVYLLAAESIYLLTETLTDVKLGDESQTPVVRKLDAPGVPENLRTVCLGVLAATESTREELMAALRLLVILTRDDDKSCDAELLRAVLSNFKTTKASLAGCHSYLAMIARHAFDDADALREVMRREIRQWTTPSRNKVADVNHFLRQLRQMAYRDTGTFLNAVEDECTLVDPSPSQSVYHVHAKDSPKVSETSSQQQVSTDPFQRTDHFQHHPVMDFFVSELGTTLRVIQHEEAEFKHGTAYSDQITELYTYASLIVALITELVGSYFTAKAAFMASIRQGTLYGIGKGKSGITAIISDLVCPVSVADVRAKIDKGKGVAEMRRLALSSSATSLIVALSSNITLTSDAKEIPEDLHSVRKAVLDGIAKALKDGTSGHAHHDLDTRYGRLWALGELIHHLLTSRPSVVPIPTTDDSTLQIAKAMLEKNYVSLMTSAIAEIDLNYPEVCNVLDSLLKALDHLTKISIKWGKSESKKEDGEEHAPSSGESSDEEEASDVEMSDDGREGPDIYRNSALGILGGDIADDEDEDEMDEDDEDGDDSMMEAFAEDMEHGMDDDSGTEPSSDEDDDDENDIGIEGEWTTDDEVDDDHDLPILADGDELQEMEDGVPWDDGMMEGDDMDMFDSEQEDDEDDEAMLEGAFAGGFEPDPDDLDFDDEEFDEIDEIDGLRLPGGASRGLADNREHAGFWGWQEPGSRLGDAGRRPRDVESAATSLFGLAPRAINTSQHPLLAHSRPNDAVIPSGFNQLNNINDLLLSLEGLAGPQAVQFLESVVNQSRHNGAETIRVDLAHRHDGTVGLSIGGRSFNMTSPLNRNLPATLDDIRAEYKPLPTMQRWGEEQELFPFTNADQIARMVIHLINRLLPAARKASAEEAERVRKLEEEAAAALEKKREEELALAASLNLPESRPETAQAELFGDDIEMHDVEFESDDDEGDQDDEEEIDDDDDDGEDDEEDNNEAPSGGPDRVTISIRGQEIDITDTGIDLDFLQALPDDMRADVVEQHMREQNRLTRPAAANMPATTSQINAEFLAALPPDIRAEVIMQESLESARRALSAPTATRQGPPEAAPNQNFLQALTSDLRDVLMEGTSMERAVAEYMMMSAARPSGSRPPGISAIDLISGHASRAAPLVTKPKRDAIQLLDKPGIASLVRLLFFPEVLSKTYLFRSLVNLCENSKTRADLLNLLLSIVQDGSGDLQAVDRSFQQMSLRGLTATPKATPTPKGKSVDTPAPLTSGLFTNLQADHIPTFIAQRCFEALSFIVLANGQAVTYFLTEHEQPVGLKKAPTKKGKGKEKHLPQTKFPIVILIGLLDRSTLLKTPGMMESLTGLLAAITKPLFSLSSGKAPEASTSVTLEDIGMPPPLTEQQSTSVPAAPVALPVTETDGSGTAVNTTTPATSGGKPQMITAPVIPPPILRLVVNCLTIGDCTSRTFTQTLVVLQNLSCIPDGKTILVQELCARSQQLGTAIEGELLELAGTLEDKEHELGSLTLSKFSPASSSQAQLLRLLKTIDYLYSKKADAETKDREMSESEREASEIYRSFDFSSMWRQLGDCLTLAESRESTEQIAAVLLPLVEALMVVCKYTRPAAADIMSPVLSPMLSPTPQPADLFVAFTTTHRKVLNAIVRNNPSLMSGSFSLLITNPKVLEFDNKRNWFFQKLKRKRDQQGYGTLHINIRRRYAFEESYRAMVNRSGEEIKYGKINVKFINEDGVDAGGVTREWYSVLAQQIFDPNFALFEPCAADAQTYQPNKHSSVVENHLSFFKFVGRVIGKAIYDGRLLDAYFSRAFYKQILGKTVDTRDLESIDPEYHKSLQWMLDNDITGVIDQEFTIEDDSFGEKKVVELKEGGAKIAVTEDNKEEYVRLVVSYRLENSIKEQMNSFLTGFYDIIPRHLIQIFEPDQLELLISGISSIDVDELKNATQMSGWKSTDAEISWFWRALRSFSQEERSRFLMFVTSSSRVPLGGFNQLQGSSGTQPFQIQKLYGKEGILPQASTCFNLLLLPTYGSYEQLRERLLFAVTETSGFGKA